MSDLEPGTYTATLDRVEETADGTDLAVLIVEREDEGDHEGKGEGDHEGKGEGDHEGEAGPGADALSQVDLPLGVVPREGRHVDAVFGVTVDAERFELAFRGGETARRAEAAQSRFDRLAQRPPSSEG
jgi:hypothetical protein